MVVVLDDQTGKCSVVIRCSENRHRDLKVVPPTLGYELRYLHFAVKESWASKRLRSRTDLQNFRILNRESWEMPDQEGGETRLHPIPRSIRSPTGGYRYSPLFRIVDRAWKSDPAIQDYRSQSDSDSSNKDLRNLCLWEEEKVIFRQYKGVSLNSTMERVCENQESMVRRYEKASDRQDKSEKGRKRGKKDEKTKHTSIDVGL